MSNVIEFPTVNTQTVHNELQQTVDARDLHTFLEVGKDFSNWIKDRINKYNFVENQDFIVFTNFGENPSGGRPSKEYHLTLDMAKELSMVERNERGREARQYFIDCEKKLIHQMQQPASVELENPDWLRGTLLTYTEKCIEQQATIEKQQFVIADQKTRLAEVEPKIQEMEKRFTKPDLPPRDPSCVNITEAASHLGMMNCGQLTSYLQSKGLIRRIDDRWDATSYATHVMGVLQNHQYAYFTRKDKCWHTATQVLVTGKGLEKLRMWFKAYNVV